MFLKKNVKKVRSIVSGFALAGLTAAALILSADTAINAQTPDDAAATAPRGGAANKFLDFNGNGTTDYVTLGFTTGGPINWYVTGNPANPLPNQAFIRNFDYGFASSDAIVVGDYIGDNKADLAVFRTAPATSPGPGIWYVSQFPNGTAGVTLDRAVRWGNASDVPVTGDYDGDGKADYVVVRANADGILIWYILYSGTNTTRRTAFGQLPAAGASLGAPTVFDGADFNGDGRDELIYVTTNASGTQVIYNVGDATTGAGLITRAFGNFNTDTSLTPADYTGDGKADFVTCRQTATDGVIVWYILNSATGVTTGTRFGIADPTFTGDGDVPVRGDYDGDNRHDIAVWRPSNQTFYFLSTMFGNVQSQKSGRATDFPLGGFGGY